jgi:hypothetical protein
MKAMSARLLAGVLILGAVLGLGLIGSVRAADFTGTRLPAADAAR